MKLFFLCFFVSLCGFTMSMLAEKHTNIKTVMNPQDQCADGDNDVQKSRKCSDDKEELVWYIRLHRKAKKGLTESETEEFHNIEDCIFSCTKRGNCFGVMLSKEHNKCFFYFNQFDFEEITADDDTEKRADAQEYTSIKLICCQLKLIDFSSEESYHNLPIIFNPQTDCTPDSVDGPCCPDKKVWVVSVHERYENNYMEAGFRSRLECMNECINYHYGECFAMEEQVGLLGTCVFNKEKSTLKPSQLFNLFELKCCNVKNDNLWFGRYRALPILYDMKKMCSSHKPIKKGSNDCNAKVWHAFDHAVIKNEHDLLLQLGNETLLTTCLDSCLRNLDCLAVTIRPKKCWFFHTDKIKFDLGYRLATSYQLTCCEMN